MEDPYLVEEKGNHVKLEIDVSGEDLLSKNYTICVADKDGFVKGYKFDEKTVKVLSSRYGQGFYRYKKSKKEKALFKIRIYSVIVFNLLKSLGYFEKVSLDICRDFYGREQDIRNNLNFFVERHLGKEIVDLRFVRLGKDSNAHKYAYLMRKDNKDKLDTYINISLEDIEKWLKK